MIMGFENNMPCMTDRIDTKEHLMPCMTDRRDTILNQNIAYIRGDHKHHCIICNHYSSTNHTDVQKHITLVHEHIIDLIKATQDSFDSQII